MMNSGSLAAALGTIKTCMSDRGAKRMHLPCLGWRGFKEILIIDRLESSYFELLQLFSCFHCRRDDICDGSDEGDREVTRCSRRSRVYLDLSGSSGHDCHLEKLRDVLFMFVINRDQSIQSKTHLESVRVSRSFDLAWQHPSILTCTNNVLPGIVTMIA